MRTLVKSIVVIIPTFNRREYLRVLLSQLFNQNGNNLLEIVVVVAGSTDGTLEMLQDEFPEVHVVKGTAEWWWTKSINTGIRFVSNCNPKYVLLLNDDVELPNDYLESIIKATNENPKCLIGSASKDLKNKEFNYIGIKRDWKKVWSKPLVYSYDLKNLPEHILVNQLPGRGLLIPNEVFSKIGFFDEKNFPQAIADADFSIRANKAGYNLIVSTRAYLFSYVEEGPNKFYESKYCISNFIKRLYEKRSNQNLYYLFKFNYRHCPGKWFISYTTINFIAIILGYLKRWIKQHWERVK